jgi:thioredoxin-like negative regulator of GroEL
MIEIQNPSAFETYLNQDKAIMLFFHTDSCNPCRSLMFILEKLSFEHQEKIVFLKARADKNVTLAKQFGVTQVPTLIIIKNIETMERVSGLITEKGLRIKLDQLIN